MDQDIQNGVSKQKCAANFLYTLASAIIHKATYNNFQHVTFSGGVFQNTTFVDMLIKLSPIEIKLYFHNHISPNDENISFGQICHYLNIKN